VKVQNLHGVMLSLMRPQITSMSLAPASRALPGADFTGRINFMKHIYGNEFVSPLVTQISWTNHLLILSGAKTIEEKD
jgi:hypothetical protein